MTTAKAIESMRGLAAKRVFGVSAALFAPILESVIPQLNRRKVYFEDNDVFTKRESVGLRNQIMWMETLGRAHLASATSIIRAVGWITGTIQSVESENVYAFAASLRALLEASGDSLEALTNIPINLATNFKGISSCIRGEYHKAVVIPGEFESRLIHFTFARRLAKAERDLFPASHKTRESSEYIGLLEKAIPGAHELYTLLCGITHPAFESTAVIFDHEKVPEGEIYALSDDFSKSMIDDLIEAQCGVLHKLMEISLNPGLVLLGAINVYDFKPKLDLSSLELRKLRAWKDVEQAFREEGAFSGQTVFPKIGRNEQCPCGSGKKYKKCHELST